MTGVDALDVKCATCGHLGREHAYVAHSERNPQHCLVQKDTGEKSSYDGRAIKERCPCAEFVAP